MPGEREPLESQNFISEVEAARRLCVSRFVLLRARQLGAIGHYRFGDRVMYSPAQLAEYMQQCERRVVLRAA